MAYGITEIPSIVTDAFNDAVGKNGTVAQIDSTNFVDCGSKLSDFELMDGWYGSLAKRIIKVLFFAKEYNEDTRKILRDESTFGAFVEKLYTIAPDAVDNPTWKYEPNSTTRKITQVSPYDLEDTLQVKSVIFGKSGTWSYEFVMPMIQLKKAWQTPAEMIGFIDSQFIAVRNKITKARIALEAAAINTAIAKALSVGNAVNLLGEYVAETGDSTITDKDGFLIQAKCLKNGNKNIKKVVKGMKKLSVRHNAERYENFSTDDSLHLEILQDYAAASEFYLESDAYHKELVSLPGYSEIDAWMYTGDEVLADVDDTSLISIKNDQIGQDPVVQSGVVGFAYDIENVAAYFGDEYEWSQPNVRQRVSNHGFQYEKGYAVNNFENAVVFYIAPVGTITADTTDAHVTAIAGSPNYAEPGKDIAFTVTCGEGYEPKKVTVTVNSKTIDITNTVDDNGKYHYTPNDTSNITVAATSQASS